VKQLIFVSTTIDRGGAELLMLQLARELRREYQIRIIYLKGKGTLREDFRALGVDPLKFGPSTLPAILRLLWRERDLVLQGWMYHGNLLACLLQGLALGRQRLFWAVHHSAAAYAGQSGRQYLRLKCTAWLSGLARGIAYVSEPVRAEHEGLGYARRKSVVIHNGIELRDFARDREAGLRLRQQLGIGPEDTVVGAVGRNHPDKDYPTLLSAVFLLLRRHPRLHFVAAGRGLKPENFASQLAELNPEERRRLHLLDERRDVLAILSALDVYTLSSLSESFSLSLIEALAAGLCCVSTDVVWFSGLFPQALKTVPTRDAPALAVAVEEWLDLPGETRRQLGWQARETVGEVFSLDRTVSGYKELWIASVK